MCGEILELSSGPECANFKVGQRVIGLGIEHAGGFGEEMTINGKVWLMLNRRKKIKNFT